MSSHSLIGLALAAGILGGCRSDRPAGDGAALPDAEAAAPASYTFTATDYAFTGPAQIPAGLATFRLVNSGTEPHHITLVRLTDGKTFADLTAALQQPGPPPSWIHTVGGPNAPDPSGESNATLTLTPGEYAVICVIPSPDGMLHVNKGMATRLEVTAPSGPAGAEPAADIVMTLSDYDFTLSAPLRSGSQTIRVDNPGPQEHEIVLARLAPGKTAADLVNWAMTGMQGPPSASFLGGISLMQKGEHNFFTATLEPGEYALLCFVHDANDGKPHVAHGMVKQVTVS